MFLWCPSFARSWQCVWSGSWLTQSSLLPSFLHWYSLSGLPLGTLCPSAGPSEENDLNLKECGPCTHYPFWNVTGCLSFSLKEIQKEAPEGKAAMEITLVLVHTSHFSLGVHMQIQTGSSKQFLRSCISSKFPGVACPTSPRTSLWGTKSIRNPVNIAQATLEGS